MNQKPTYHVASFSGGKDSTAMVLRMIELGYPLDEVIFCDTTMEFPGMLRHVEKVKQVVEAAGIKFTILKEAHGFEYYLCEHKPKKRKPPKNRPADFVEAQGYGWPGHLSRWCTKTLKTAIIKKYLDDLHERYNVIQYIGIAADEGYRLEREQNQDKAHRHPLVEWNWAEADALAYCYERGYDWEGLYGMFKRVSCWCCPLQQYDELRVLRKNFPDLWQELLRLDARQCKKFAHGYTVAEFDRRFALENALTEQGYSIKNRPFFADLKRLLADEATIETILKEREEKET